MGATGKSAILSVRGVISGTASVVASEVKDVANDAVKGSRVITEGISRGTTAAGDWVSDQSNGVASRLDEWAHPRLASAARGGGVLAATATKTVGEVAGQAVALDRNGVGFDSAGTNIGVGAARVSLATNSEERGLELRKSQAELGKERSSRRCIEPGSRGRHTPRCRHRSRYDPKQVNQANREQFIRFEGQVTQEFDERAHQDCNASKCRTFYRTCNPRTSAATNRTISRHRHREAVARDWGNHLIDAKSVQRHLLLKINVPVIR